MEACRFIQSEHQVHALDALTGGAFDQIVFDNQNDKRVAISGAVDSHAQVIGRTNGARFRMRPGWQYIDKRVV